MMSKLEEEKFKPGDLIAFKPKYDTMIWFCFDKEQRAQKQWFVDGQTFVLLSTYESSPDFIVASILLKGQIVYIPGWSGITCHFVKVL